MLTAKWGRMMTETATEPLFTVSDGYELHALFLALMEAKFHPKPEMPELQGSPFIARLCERAAEAVAVWMVSKGWSADAERMRAVYRCEPSPVVLARLRQQVVECKKWSHWSDDERTHYVRLLLSPYTPGEAVVRQLVDERVGFGGDEGQGSPATD